MSFNGSNVIDLYINICKDHIKELIKLMNDNNNGLLNIERKKIFNYLESINSLPGIENLDIKVDFKLPEKDQ